MLNANQGAGQKMGQQIGSSLANQAGQVKQGIQAGQQGFQAGMQQGSQQANQAIGQGQQLQKNANETDEVYQSRLAGQDQSQLATQGQALTNAAYQGPQGLQNAGQLSSRAATASALGQLGATSSGQGQLLASQVAKRGNYGQGQNALDQMLIGKGGQQEIQQGRSAVGGIQNQAQGAIQGATAQANATQQDIEGRKVATQHDLGANQKAIQDAAAKQATDYNTNAGKLQQMLAGKNPDGTTIDATHPSQYSDQDVSLLNNMKDYGLDPNQMIYGTNAENQQNYLAQLGSGANLTQAEKYQGQQAAAANALASFSGDQNAGKIGANQFGNAFSAGQQQNVSGSMTNQQQADQAAVARSNQQLALAQQAEMYDYNAAHPMGGDSALGKQRALMDTARRNQMQEALRQQGFNANETSAQVQQDIAGRTGTQKSALQLALERMGKTYTPPGQGT
jgi:hypothetical protein